MKRLNFETWKNIFRNTAENDEEVEVTWLDNVPGPGEYGLACEDDLFEDGFQTEQEAQERLDYLYSQYCIKE